MSRSDCHAAILPPRLFSLLEDSLRNGMALPSSHEHRPITCHGLRPRHIASDSPLRLPPCWLPGHETLGPVQRWLFRGSTPSLALWPIISLPSASHSLLPPYARNSVPAWWLAFDRTGLSSWRSPASLGARRVDIIWSPHLGLLCVPCFSSLSIEECHNIQPCEVTSMPLTEPDLRISTHPALQQDSRNARQRIQVVRDSRLR